MAEPDLLEGAEHGLLARLRRSVIAISVKCHKGDPVLGTGFLVAPGLVATCAHVVETASGLTEIAGEAVGPGRRFKLDVIPDRVFKDSNGLDLAFLAAKDVGDLQVALLHGRAAVSDPLWSYGHPAGTYRGGQPARFTVLGPALRATAIGPSLIRLEGTPVAGGQSGSPVLNLRTGAVCGMLCTSSGSGSAHMLGANEIIDRSEEAKLQLELLGFHQEWLLHLSDDQIKTAGWQFPGPQVRRYLHLASKAAQRHPYPGIVMGSPPPLSDVYVQQMVQAGDGEPGADEDIDKLSALSIVEGTKNSVIVGGAGAGKSSLLRHIVSECAGKVAALDPEIAPGPVSNGLKVRPAIPSSVPVRVLAADLVAPRPLPDAIADSVGVDLSAIGLVAAWEPEFFREAPFPSGRWLVLVDGLDEVTDEIRRSAVVSKLVGVSSRAESVYQFLLTTRPLDSHSRAALPWSGSLFVLQPFEDSDLLNFAERWFHKLASADPPDKAKRFSRLLRRANLSELARNPLMATMLCQLYAADPDAALPASRMDIYQRFTSLIHMRQFSSDRSGVIEQISQGLAPFGRTAQQAGERLVEHMLEFVGQIAFARQQGDQRPALELLEQFIGPLRPHHVTINEWQKLCYSLLRRTGVLTDRGSELAFLHQTIGEYFAAQHILNDPRLSDSMYSAVFHPSSPLLEQSSLTRFLVAGWLHRPDLDDHLETLAEKGLEGPQLITELAADGVSLSSVIREKASVQLAAIAMTGTFDESQRRTAASLLIQLTFSDGHHTLRAIVRDAMQPNSYRIWALDALAEAEMPDETNRRTQAWADYRVDGASRYRVIRSLARSQNSDVVKLLVDIAYDSSFEILERLWSAEELHLQNHKLAQDALLAVASDADVDLTQRQQAAKYLDGRKSDKAADLLSILAALAQPLTDLLATHTRAHPKAKTNAIHEAYSTARRRLDGRLTESGEEYLTQALAVATILANLGMDTTTLVTALLHHTIADADYTLEQLRTDFGEEVALLVDGVTKLDKVKLGDAAKAEVIRKMIVSVAKDPRVLTVKLADRLHHMRTLNLQQTAENEREARETLEILVPLADRLGMSSVKWELEDLSFAHLFPKRFKEIQRLVDEHMPQREELLRQVTDQVSGDLRSAKIRAKVTGRPKHLYSIYQKMIVRGRDFNEIYDLVGVRILVDTVRDCYATLGVIHAAWQPVPGRFKDYIAMPTADFYQSLHTTVIGPKGKPIEIRVRTHAMHDAAEYGMAAMRRRRRNEGEEDQAPVGASGHIDGMTWLRQLLDWQRETSDPGKFLDSLRRDLSSQEVFVFTPKGEVLALPNGSTPVDFAYAVHTEVGHRCIGARVNSKLVPLESILSNGDVVEIFTSKSETAGPTQDWLGYVKSSRAKTKIRQYFNKERHDEAIDAGKDMLARAMRRHGLPLQRLLTAGGLLAIARELHLGDITSLYTAVGEGQISVQAVVQKLVARYGDEEGALEDISETTVPTKPSRTKAPGDDPGVEVKGVSNVGIKLARCCTPVSGSTIFGFLTRSGGISVHRDDCTISKRLRVQPERLVEVKWKPAADSMSLVAIQIEALDRHKLLADITHALSEEGVNILSATVTTTRDRITLSRFSFEMPDPKHLGHLLNAVRDVEGVLDCYRVTSGT